MKRFFAIALMAALLLPLFAQTEADFTVRLTKDGEGVVITDYTGKVAAVRIPATIQGMPVREIMGFYSVTFNNYKASPTSVIIPEGVTIIGPKAFSSNLTSLSGNASDYRPRLTSVILPEGLLEIGEGAFRMCPLTSITLPQSLTTIGRHAFSDTYITEVTIPGNLTRIEPDIFANCKRLKNVTISEGITTTHSGGYGRSDWFSNCTALTTVTLPSTLTTIGSNTFYGCSALNTITLPASITTIEREAFYSCSSLTTVIIPDSIEKIRFVGNSAFERCSKLTLASQAVIKRVGYTGSF